MDIESVKKNLLNCKNKRITRQFIAEAILNIPPHHTKEIYDGINSMTDNGLIRPNTKSGTNGNHLYPLYNKYTITVTQDENIIRQIRDLHPLISKSTYLRKNPQVFKQYETHFASLSNYLFRNPNPIPISRKERSYEIFGIEKLLETKKDNSKTDNLFAKALIKMGINSNVLNYYDTPEYCFHDYIEENAESPLLVICENKDIWFNIRKYMHEEGKNTLFGHKINGVIYGEGNRISSKDALTAYLEFAHIKNAAFLYWGDIDLAGIHILQKTITGNPTLSIKPFTSAYEEMLSIAIKRYDTKDLELCNTKDTISDNDIFALGDISRAYESYLKTILTQNRRIPQEIITYFTLRG